MISLDKNILIMQGPDGEKIYLKKWSVIPGTITSLLDFYEGKPCAFELINCVTLNNDLIAKVSVEVSLSKFADSVAIVRGGWLPPSLALTNARVFADRNFVSNLVASYENGKLANVLATSSAITDFEKIPFVVDILPFVLEANIKNFPTRQLIDEQLDEVEKKLRKALPRIEIGQYSGITLGDYAEKLLRHLRPLMEKRQKFFYEFAHTFPSNSSSEKVVLNWIGIAKLAHSLGLASNDFAVMLVLLTTSSGQSGWPGSGVLKSHKQYTMEEAYNAACDVMLIEILLNHHDMAPNANYIAMTGDKNLAKVAAVMGNLKNGRADGKSKIYKMAISTDLFKGDLKLAGKFAKILDGKMLELLPVKSLCAGDILLCYSDGKWDIIGDAIDSVTGSRYGHAAIYLGKGLVLESTVVEGVAKIKIQDFLQRYEHVAVFRQPDAWTDENLELLNKFAKNVLSSDAHYNLAGVVKYVRVEAKHQATVMREIELFLAGKSISRPTLKKKYFCSELVVDCFIAVGFIAPSAAIYYRSDTFSPVKLANDATFGTFVGYISCNKDHEVSEDDEFYNRATFEEIFGSQ